MNLTRRLRLPLFFNLSNYYVVTMEKMEPQSNYVFFDIKYLNGKVVFNIVVHVIFHGTFCNVVVSYKPYKTSLPSQARRQKDRKLT